MFDHVNLDLEELGWVNAFLRDGLAAYGPDFVERINVEARARGAPPRRPVDSLVIRRSHDIGAIAAAFLERERVALRKQLSRGLLWLIDVGEGAQAADVASYLLFDGSFAGELIALGREEARAQHDALARFIFD